MCSTILSWPLSFQFTDQLCRHYDNDKAHTDRMKRYGVEKLLVDERTRVKQKRRRTPSPDKVIYVHRTEYIIIDEWSEEVDRTDCEGKTRMEDKVMLHCHHCTLARRQEKICASLISLDFPGGCPLTSSLTIFQRILFLGRSYFAFPNTLGQSQSNLLENV